MSESATASPAKPRDRSAPLFDDEKMYLVSRVVDDIAPNLSDRAQDAVPARQMVWRMIRSYRPMSEAEVVDSARILSMSFVQLDLLRDLTRPDLTLPMKLRGISGAVALGRAISQAERDLACRQKAEERQQALERFAAPPRAARAADESATLDAVGNEAVEDFHMRQEIDRLHKMAQQVLDETESLERAKSKPTADPVEPDQGKSAANGGSPKFDAFEDFMSRVVDGHRRQHGALRPGQQPADPGAAASKPAAAKPGAGTQPGAQPPTAHPPAVQPGAGTQPSAQPAVTRLAAGTPFGAQPPVTQPGTGTPHAAQPGAPRAPGAGTSPGKDNKAARPE